MRGGKITLRGLYPPELLAPIIPEGGGPLPGKLCVGRYSWTGPTGPGSTPAFASRNVLTLSLDAISVKASLATAMFPDI